MSEMKQVHPLSENNEHEQLKAEVEDLREQFLNVFYEVYEGPHSAAAFPRKRYERMMAAADLAWEVVSCKIIQGDVPIEEFDTLAGCMSWFYSEMEDSL